MGLLLYTKLLWLLPILVHAKDDGGDGSGNYPSGLGEFNGTFFYDIPIFQSLSNLIVAFAAIVIAYNGVKLMVSNVSDFRETTAAKNAILAAMCVIVLVKLLPGLVKQIAEMFRGTQF